MEEMNNPVFVLGAPRSGTTFLASLLKKTEYGSPFETQFITKYYKRLAHYGDINSFLNFQKLVTDILGERAVQQWKLEIDQRALFDALDGQVTYSRLVNKLCHMAAAKKGYRCWGEKTPHYLADIDILFKLFPDSKYIYIVRDGRDVTLSLLEKDWGPNNVYYSAKYWVNLNRESACLDKLNASGNLHQLKYENLLNNVEQHIKDIYVFLDLEYNQSEVTELASTVKVGNYNKWKERMNARQVDTFDRIASKTLKRFGYEQSTNEKSVSFFWKIIYFSHNALFRVRHLFIINVIDGIKIRFFGKEPFAE